MEFQTEAEINDFLARFESSSIPKAEWTHAAHVAIAGAYVWADPDTALPLIRAGIISLNRSNQVANTATSGYHETLTVFWFSIVKDFCSSRRAEGRRSVINQMMTTLPTRLFQRYYGFDVVKSQRARERWVEPDLQPLSGEW